jgi:hypothetical protein
VLASPLPSGAHPCRENAAHRNQLRPLTVCVRYAGTTAGGQRIRPQAVAAATTVDLEDGELPDDEPTRVPHPSMSSIDLCFRRAGILIVPVLVVADISWPVPWTQSAIRGGNGGAGRWGQQGSNLRTQMGGMRGGMPHGGFGMPMGAPMHMLGPQGRGMAPQGPVNHQAAVMSNMVVQQLMRQVGLKNLRAACVRCKLDSTPCHSVASRVA